MRRPLQPVPGAANVYVASGGGWVAAMDAERVVAEVERADPEAFVVLRVFRESEAGSYVGTTFVRAAEVRAVSPHHASQERARDLEEARLGARATGA